MKKDITSTANPLFKHLKALSSSKKAREESGEFIVEGWRGVETLLSRNESRASVERLVVSAAWNGGALPDAIETIELPDHLFSKISDTRNAQGVLAVVKKSAAAFNVPATGRFLLLDNLRDPGNLGALIRSAVGAGFSGVLLRGDCVEPTNPKVIRSTMGTFAFANIHAIDDDALDALAAADFQFCATTGDGGENLYDASFGDRVVLMIGSEAHGVSDELFARAAKKITIPLQPECESLNAAIAGSICMFQIARGERA